MVAVAVVVAIVFIVVVPHTSLGRRGGLAVIHRRRLWTLSEKRSGIGHPRGLEARGCVRVARRVCVRACKWVQQVVGLACIPRRQVLAWGVVGGFSVCVCVCFFLLQHRPCYDNMLTNETYVSFRECVPVSLPFGIDRAFIGRGR